MAFALLEVWGGSESILLFGHAVRRTFRLRSRRAQARRRVRTDLRTGWRKSLSLDTSRTKVYSDRGYLHTTLVRHAGTTVALALAADRRISTACWIWTACPPRR